MEQFELYVEEVRPLAGLAVCRCGDGEFGVGDDFTELHWKRYERDSLRCVETGIEAEVRLRVLEIESWGRLWDRAPCGHGVGVRFTGEGLHWLTRLDFEAERRAGRYWTLWGSRDDGGVWNCGDFAYPQAGVIRPECLTSTVIGLAQTIWTGCRFDLLTVLADALEEAGCDDGDILRHCRGPGPHTRVCHVLRQLLPGSMLA
jgi:hypothetical protein